VAVVVVIARQHAWAGSTSALRALLHDERGQPLESSPASHAGPRAFSTSSGNPRRARDAVAVVAVARLRCGRKHADLDPFLSTRAVAARQRPRPGVSHLKRRRRATGSPTKPTKPPAVAGCAANSTLRTSPASRGFEGSRITRYPCGVPGVARRDGDVPPPFCRFRARGARG
jgi:hypothetical protein